METETLVEVERVNRAIKTLWPAAMRGNSAAMGIVLLCLERQIALLGFGDA